MIIILSNRTDTKARNNQVRTNARTFSKFQKDKTILELDDIRSLEYSATPDSKLFVMAHGNPDYIGEANPETFAKAVARYVVKNKLDHLEIYLHSCNSGYTPCNGASFAEAVTLKLTLLLKSNVVVDVYGAKGMIMYLANGEPIVVKDNDPLTLDTPLMRAISRVDSSVKGKALAALHKEGIEVLTDEPFSHYTTADIAKFLSSQDECIIDEETANLFQHRQIGTNRHAFFMTQRAHDLLLEAYPMRANLDTAETMNPPTGTNTF